VSEIRRATPRLATRKSLCHKGARVFNQDQKLDAQSNFMPTP
jgi:hypothetical protein